MTFTNEQITKARSAKTAEELLAMAKESGIEMTEAQAAKYFAELNKQGELNDSELASVAGGGKGDPTVYYTEALWAAAGCGCNSFSQKSPYDSDKCGNCNYYCETDSQYGKGFCTRDLNNQ